MAVYDATIQDDPLITNITTSPLGSDVVISQTSHQVITYPDYATVTFYIHNQSGNTISLNSVDATNNTGIDLTLPSPLPVSLGPNKYALISLTATELADFVIEAGYNFVFSNGTTLSLDLRGYKTYSEGIIQNHVDIDTGVLTNKTRFSLVLANNTDTSVTLDSVGVTGNDNIEMISFGWPTTLAPRDNTEFQFDVLPLGGATFDALYSFHFSNGDVKTFRLHGERNITPTHYARIIDDPILYIKPYAGGAPSDGSVIVNKGVLASQTEFQLGRVVSDREFEFTLFNCSSSSVTISSIAYQYDTGVTLVLPNSTPMVLAPYQTIPAKLYIEKDGHHQVTTGIDISLSNGKIISLKVTGYRAAIFPVAPQWDKGVLERLKWKNSLTTKISGSEQRVGLRALPRVDIEYTVLVNAEERAVMERLFKLHGDSVYYLPLWMYSFTVAQDYPQGGVSIEVNISDYRITSGTLLCVLGDDGTYYAYAAKSYINGILTLETPLKTGISKGEPLHPIALTQLINDIDAKKLARDVWESTLMFQSVSVIPWEASEFDANTYRGEPLLIAEQNHIDALEVSFLPSVDVYDNEVSDLSTRETTHYIPSNFGFNFVFQGKDQLDKYKQWLYSRRGILTPVWVPTWDEDMQVAIDHTLEPAGKLTIKKKKSVDHTHTDYQHIFVMKRDGEFVATKITNVEDNLNGTLTLDIDASLPASLTPNNTLICCYLRRCRLEGDDVEINWVTPDITKSTVGFRTLKNHD